MILSGGAIDLMRRREKYRQSDAAISSSDALREALAPFPEPGPGKSPLLSGAERASRRREWQERKKLYDGRTNRFLAAVKLDALRLLSEAETLYRDAWYSTSSIR